MKRYNQTRGTPRCCPAIGIRGDSKPRYLIEELKFRFLYRTSWLAPLGVTVAECETPPEPCMQLRDTTDTECLVRSAR